MLPLTDHALFEMKRRGISEETVQKIFEKPEQKIRVTKNREIWQNKVDYQGKSYMVRIVLETDPNIRIVTVYKSSKIKKYWRNKI